MERYVGDITTLLTLTAIFLSYSFMPRSTNSSPVAGFSSIDLDGTHGAWHTDLYRILKKIRK